jgi:RNA polymerase sigma-70 factor (ECF subfamily)
VNPTPPTEAPEGQAELLRRFLAGDTATWQTVGLWAGRVVRFKGYRIPPHEREDVVHQALISVWRSAGREGFSLHTGLRAFVRKVTLARCIDWMRRSRATAELPASLPDPRPAPDETLAQEREAERVVQALRRLDPSCQEIIRLHFFEELPYVQIAARMGRAEATMRVRMFHCMKELRRLLAPGEE